MNRNLFFRQALGRFSRQSRRIAAVAVDSGSVRITQTVHRPGGAVIEKMIVSPLPEGALADQARILRNLWLSQGLETEDLVLVFPQREAIVKTVTLPSVEPQEIQEMVRLQAMRQTPLGSDEITVVHQIVQTLPDGSARVLVAIVRQEDLQRRLALLQEAGLSPRRVVLDAWVILPMLRGNEAGTGLSMAIDSGVRGLAFGIFEGARLCLTRSIPIPASVKPGTASWARYFRQEIEKTLLGYPTSLPSGDRWRIFIGGADSAVTSAVEAAREIESVSARAVKPEDRVGMSREELKQDAAVCWDTIAASGSSPLSNLRGTNLLSKDAQDRHTHQTRQRELIAVLLFSLLFGFALAGSLLQRYEARRAELRQLDRLSAALSPEVKELRRMERRINSLKSKMSEEGTFLSIVTALNRIVPAGVSVNALNFEQGGAMTLQGSCKSLSDSLKLVESLQRSPLFSAVELRSSDVQRVHDQDTVGFTISLTSRASLRRGKGERTHAKA